MVARAQGARKPGCSGLHPMDRGKKKPKESPDRSSAPFLPIPGIDVRDGVTRWLKASNVGKRDGNWR